MILNRKKPQGPPKYVSVITANVHAGDDIPRDASGDSLLPDL